MTNISKNSKLESLFQSSFNFENLMNFKKQNSTDFHCSNCSQCNDELFPQFDKNSKSGHPEAALFWLPDPVLR